MAAAAPAAAADAEADQPSAGAKPSDAEATPAAQSASITADADMAEAAEDAADDAAEADDAQPESNAEPVTLAFRTFASGAECYDYFHGLLTKLSHEQDLNEVGLPRRRWPEYGRWDWFASCMKL